MPAAMLWAAPLVAHSAGGDAPPAAVIVVTASRTDAAAPGVTTVTTGEIERLQPVSLLDVLDDVAGVRAVSTGGVGGNAFVSVRGGEPNFTMVLLDGIKLNNPTNSRGGAFDLAQIDPSVVESIVVARGAVSAVHGSDALSGAITIRLREPSHGTTAGAMTLQGGTRGDVGANASFQYGWISGSILASVGAYRSGNLDLGSDLDRRQALLRISRSVGGFDAVLVALDAHSDRTTFPEDSGGPLLSINRARETIHSDLLTLGATYRRKPDAALRPNLSVSFSQATDVDDIPKIAPGVFGGVPAITTDDRFSRIEAVADLGATLGPTVSTVGVSLLREVGRSHGSIDVGVRLPVVFAQARTTVAAFAETTLRPTRSLTVDLAGRLDAPDGTAGRLTGRGGFTYELSDGLPEAYATIGEGYKLPSFYALGHPLVGNPSLRPERSVDAEVGIRWKRGPGNGLRVAAFQNVFRDLIDFDPAAFRIVNRNRVRTRGIEGEGSWQVVREVRISAAITWLVVDSPTPLRNRPRWQGNAHVVWQPVRSVELDAGVRANADFFDSSIPTGPVVAKAHGEADLGVRYRVSEKLRASLVVRNVGDARFQDAVGFPSSGRIVRLTLSATTF